MTSLYRLSFELFDDCSLFHRTLLLQNLSLQFPKLLRRLRIKEHSSYRDFQFEITDRPPILEITSHLRESTVRLRTKLPVLVQLVKIRLTLHHNHYHNDRRTHRTLKQFLFHLFENEFLHL